MRIATRIAQCVTWVITLASSVMTVVSGSMSMGVTTRAIGDRGSAPRNVERHGGEQEFVNSNAQRRIGHG